MPDGRETVTRTSGLAHLAFFYEDEDAYYDTLSGFLEVGIAKGEPAMVAVSNRVGARVAKDFGSRNGLVHYLDIACLGRNPARIIPAALGFLHQQAKGAPARFVGGHGAVVDWSAVEAAAR